MYTVPVSSHNMFGLRVDTDPFKDARVRRAVALTLNRPDIVNRVLLGPGQSETTRLSSASSRQAIRLPQRKQNIALARALLNAAGQENLRFTITTHNQFDVPDYAAAIQAAARQAGITIDLDVMTYDDYYAAVGGGDYATTTPWLNKPATITEYGARGVPNLYITAAYMTNGIWNASKYSNNQFDAAARSYLGSADLKTQRKRDEEDGGPPPP